MIDLSKALEAFAQIETKTNEAVAKWAMEYVVPYLGPINVQKTQMNADVIDRRAVIEIIEAWFPGDSINSDKWAGKSIVRDINALPSLESVNALVKAARDLHTDLLERAEWDDDVKVVCAGAGAWFRFTHRAFRFR
jgi:hypothetical protein